MNRTNIAWTDYTWNPLSGCTQISEGCVNCYAKATEDELMIATEDAEHSRTQFEHFANCKLRELEPETISIFLKRFGN